MTEINSPKALEAWLADRPLDRASSEQGMIAARIALRVLPPVLSVFDIAEARLAIEPRQDLILQCLRVTFTSWVVHKYQTYELSTDPVAKIAAAKAAAARAAAAYAAAAPTVAAANAAAPAAAAVAADTALAAAAGAATAAARATGTHAPPIVREFNSAAAARAAAAGQVWSAIHADCIWLEGNRGRKRLNEQPLWLLDVCGDTKYKANLPSWARAPLDTFADGPMARDTSWKLIVDWYRAILPNRRNGAPRSLFGKQADIAIATQADEFWTVTGKRSASRVMDEVAKIAGWRGSDDKSSRPEKTIAAFIIDVVDSSDQPITIGELRQAFMDADYPVVDKTMRGGAEPAGHGEPHRSRQHRRILVGESAASGSRAASRFG